MIRKGFWLRTVSPVACARHGAIWRDPPPPPARPAINLPRFGIQIADDPTGIRHEAFTEENRVE